MQRLARFGWTVPVALAVLCSFGVAQANDTCDAADVIGPGSTTGSTVGASSDGSASCGSSGDSPDVWFSYTPASDVITEVALCDSEYDTVLSVHAGCPGDVGNELICNDDSCSLQSAVTWEATAGVTYLIRVSGFNGAEGDFTLDLSEDVPPDCAPVAGADACADAPMVGVGCVSGSTSTATVDGSASCGTSDASPDVWYQFTADMDGTLSASTCTLAFDYDTVVSIHTACPGTPANEAACNDDECDINTLQSTAVTNVTAGDTYWVRVSGFNGASGEFDLTLDFPGPCLGELKASPPVRSAAGIDLDFHGWIQHNQASTVNVPIVLRLLDDRGEQVFSKQYGPRVIRPHDRIELQDTLRLPANLGPGHYHLVLTIDGMRSLRNLTWPVKIAQ